VDNLDGWLARLIAFPFGLETLQSPLAHRFVTGWLYFVDGRVVISPVAVTELGHVMMIAANYFIPYELFHSLLRQRRAIRHSRDQVRLVHDG
jgi:hypothetical protein